MKVFLLWHTCIPCLANSSTCLLCNINHFLADSLSRLFSYTRNPLIFSLSILFSRIRLICHLERSYPGINSALEVHFLFLLHIRNRKGIALTRFFCEFPWEAMRGSTLGKVCRTRRYHHSLSGAFRHPRHHSFEAEAFSAYQAFHNVNLFNKFIATYRLFDKWKVPEILEIDFKLSIFCS